MRNKQNRNWKGGYQIDGIAYTKGEYSKYVHVYKGGAGGPMGGRKIDMENFLCTSPAKHLRGSLSAKIISLFSFQHNTSCAVRFYLM